MNKEEIYNYLKAEKIWFDVTEHQAVYNMEDLKNINCLYKNSDAKNIFVRDDKKQNYYLIVIKGDKKIDLKRFRKEYNTRPLTFASPDDLKEILNLYPGAVTPLGLLNDKNKKVKLFIDSCFNDIIGVHPNDNTATIWLKVSDLISLIKKHGNDVYIMKM